MRHIALGCISFFLFAATAKGEWLEASSDHFVIYGDQKDKALKEFSERLERFHAAMAYLYKTPRTKPSPSNRVTIFVVASAAKVRKVTGRYVSGTYIPRAGSSVAVIPRLRRVPPDFDPSGGTILYHEYAHHFMRTSLTNRVHPRWLVEGFAEFFARVTFKPDGSVQLGAPAYDLAMELTYARKVPIRSLLDYDGGVDSRSGYDSFYGQSWVLFHYLQMAPERAAQTSKYEQLLAEGRSALAAAEGAFGNLQQLEKDMDSYLRSPQLKIWILPGAVLDAGTVTVRKLRAGEAAMMPMAIESRVGVTPEEARGLVPKARKVADQYPDDPAVLTALAEAEFDAGNDDAAIAAADRALAIDPKQINARIQKGYALGRKVRSGTLPNESWKDVRIEFLKANKIENDHPVPFVQFYLGYLAQNQPPTRNAIDGLERAMELAPFDATVRWLVAQQMVSDKRFKEAAQTLAPLAYSPHPDEHADMARKLLKDVEARLEESQ